MPKRKRASEEELALLHQQVSHALHADDNSKALLLLDKLIAGGDKSCQCLFVLIALAGDKASSARLPKALADAEATKNLDAGSPIGCFCLGKVLSAQKKPFEAEVEALKGLRACAALPSSSDDDPPPTETEAAPSFLWTGSVVKVSGTSRDDLNSQDGIVTSYDATKGRFAVALKNSTVSLKAENLDSPFADCPAGFLPQQPDALRAAFQELLVECRRHTDPLREQADALKAEANALFTTACGCCGEEAEVGLRSAVGKYSEAIELHPTDASLFSNRSACYAKLGERAKVEIKACPTGSFDGVTELKKGLWDAEKCVELRPTWPKAHLRLGAALELLARLNQARDAYQRGASECYPLRGGAQKSTVGQPLETHVRQDAIFKKLNEGFQRAAKAAATSIFAL